MALAWAVREEMMCSEVLRDVHLQGDVRIFLSYVRVCVTTWAVRCEAWLGY